MLKILRLMAQWTGGCYTIDDSKKFETSKHPTNGRERRRLEIFSACEDRDASCPPTSDGLSPTQPTTPLQSKFWDRGRGCCLRRQNQWAGSPKNDFLPSPAQHSLFPFEPPPLFIQQSKRHHSPRSTPRFNCSRYLLRTLNLSHPRSLIQQRLSATLPEPFAESLPTCPATTFLPQHFLI